MFKVSAVLALTVGLLTLGTASAQDVPLECELWGINCPADGGGTGEDPGGDTGEDTGGDTGGDTGEQTSDNETPSDDPAPVEDPCVAVASKSLPSTASAQGVASSAKGLQTASASRCRAAQG